MKHVLEFTPLNKYRYIDYLDRYTYFRNQYRYFDTTVVFYTNLINRTRSTGFHVRFPSKGCYLGCLQMRV